MSVGDVFNLLFQKNGLHINKMVKGKSLEEYKLNSAQVVDTAKARSIFANTDNSYKLSAGLVKPIINADVSFIGEPVFTSEDDTTNEELKELNKKTVGYYQQAHKVALREGDYYVWVQWDDDIQSVRWAGLPGDKLSEIIRDPVSNEIIQYIFKWRILYKDYKLNDKQMVITILIDEEVIVYNYEGDVPEGYANETVRNVIGEIPVVQLSNEREDFEVKGHSEITAIEPYLKAYHDVVMMALQSQKNNSAPKLKIKTDNVKDFINTNFGPGTYEKIDSQDQDAVDIEGLDLLMMKSADDADYMTVTSTIGSAKPLLELLFYLIVETSETLELVFGANLATSRASTDNQLPIYVKKVQRKQRQFEQAWEKVVELSLKFKGFTEISAYEGDIKANWTRVDFDSAMDKVKILQLAVSSFSNALKGGLATFEGVHEQLKEFFPNMEQDFDKHIEQVKDTAMLMVRFQEDAESQMIENEGERDADTDDIVVEEDNDGDE